MNEEIDRTNFEQNPQILFAWKAPLRPYKKKGKNVLRFYLALALLLSLIIFFFGDKILLIPIWAVLFLFYTLTVTPSPEVENKITKFGIETAGITLRWETLSHFYFTRRLDFVMLTIVSRGPYFFHSYLIVPDEEIKSKVMMFLSEHLIYQDKPNKTITDKMAEWLSHLLPDEEEEFTPTSFSQKQGPTSLLPHIPAPNE